MRDAATSCRGTRLGVAGGHRELLARPPPPAVPAPGQRAAGGRSDHCRDLQQRGRSGVGARALTRGQNRRADPHSARKAAITNISGEAGKNLTFLTGHSKLAGAPLLMRVSGLSQNLTFS